jgi:outer membrane protein assembly factor BamD (BamD/ComL family)
MSGELPQAGMDGRSVAASLGMIAILVLTASSTGWGSALAQGAAADPEVERARIETMYARSRYAEAAEALARLRQAGNLSTLQRARLLLRLAAAQVEIGQYKEALRTADEGEVQVRQAGADEGGGHSSLREFCARR